MRIERMMAEFLQKGLAKGMSVKLVDRMVLLLAKTNEEFAYAIQKVRDVDPLVPESVLTWVTKWIARNNDSVASSFESILAELSSNKYTLKVTTGYLVIYGAKFPKQVYHESDRALLEVLGFKCRSKPDKAMGNRAKWWKARPDYSPPRGSSGWSDQEINARYGSVI